MEFRMYKTTSMRLIALLCYVFVFLHSSVSLSAQLLLNEMMASNASTLNDQFDNYPDWLEIYNAGESSVDLSNYWLSDDSAQLNKWNIPEIHLSSDSYLIIFASGNDIASATTFWHSVINTGATWRYHLPSSSIGDEWKSSLAATDTWNTGIAGIGYSDNDDSTIIASTITLYMQKEFEIQNLEQMTDASFYMDYDDAFVAYLNGTEIARSGSMGGSPGSPVPFDATALSQHESLMINGSPPEKFSLSDHKDLFLEGSNILAVEVHNISSGSSDLTANPFLICGFETVREEYEQGNLYIVLNDAYPHTNFKISSAGEAIYLSDGTGVIIDQIDQVVLPTDYSYGRTGIDTIPFGYYANPTPGLKNGSDFASEFFSDSVRLISGGKDYDAFQMVSLESAKAEDEIRFTLDGSPPNENSDLYTAPLTIDQTTVVKARIYRSGSLPGPVSTKTFFTEGGHNLPVISVSMDPPDLWDYNTGIYELGPNAASDNPHFGANFWQDWEKPAHVEIYNLDRQLVLNQGAGTKIYGAWSRAHAQKSMAFYARSSYGDGSFSYPLFSEKEISKYEAFVMRNGGNDWSHGMFRDGLSAYLTARMNVDHQAYEPYVMYLNGEYWGIMNMREKINENFIAENHHVYPDDVNIVEGNRVPVQGSPDSYIQMYNYIAATDFSNSSAYAQIQTLMDIQNFISFWAVNVYIDNKDWPGNNNKFWSTNAPGSLYRWISFDTDFGYGIWDNSAYTYNTLRFSLGEINPTWANPDWATLIVRKLLANDDFKRKFINEFADRMNTVYHEDNMIPVIDSFQQRIYLDASDHFSRWTSSMGSWQNEVNKMKNFFRERPEYMRQQLMDRFLISGTHDIEVDVLDPGSGYVHLNGIDLREFPFTGTYFDKNPVDLIAVPAPGFVFSHWEGDVDSPDSDTIQYDMKAPASFTAVFKAVDYPVHIVINEINYFSGTLKNTEDWVELYNRSGVTVDLSHWTVWDQTSGDNFEIPAGTILPVSGYLVLSRHRPDFKRFYPELRPLLGDLPFGIDNTMDGIALCEPDGKIHDIVNFESSSPWPTEPNGTGATLELVNSGLDNTLAANWRASLTEGGTPGKRNSQYIVGEKEYKEELKLAEARIYPSPFSETAFVDFSLEKAEKVTVLVYSTSGSLVDRIENREFASGYHKLSWTPDGSIPQGVYLVRIRASSFSSTLKVVYR